MVDGMLLLVGLVLLVVGAEALVRGASGIALLARVTPAVVGLTIVAAGTSTPELVVSVQASLDGRPGIAMGNIVGSNIFNIAAILGLCALVRPLKILSRSVRTEWPIMLASSALLTAMARDLLIGRGEALVLVAGLLLFFVIVIRVGRQDAALAGEVDPGGVATASFGREGGAALVLNLAAVAGGVGLLAGGASTFVVGAVGVARELGLSETVIGLTIVAAGTSAPELVTSLVAARRGQDDVAVTNVLGSNVFNALAIGGLAGVVRPLAVPAEVASRDCLWMLALSLLLWPFMRSGMRVGRREGAILFGAFVAYVLVLLR